MPAIASSALVFVLSLLAADRPAAAAGERERLDRGLVAIRAEQGQVYVGWRLLPSDPTDVSFNVYRQSGSAATKLTAQPVAKTTDYLDTSAPAGPVSYFVRAVTGGAEAAPSAAAACSADLMPYQSIRLQGPYDFQKIGMADLDGDGRLDYVIKHPQDNIDPYEKYWKPSPDTYKLEAYAHDGRFLWRYDLGWSIERGIWYSPYLVYDLDGDGRAEIIAKTGEGDPRDTDGRVQTGPEYVTVLDGRTAKPLAQTAWPARESFKDEGYNRASRNQLGVAYLDGKKPSLIVARGTYKQMTAVAYDYRDGKLQQRWQWSNVGAPKECQGQGAHWMHNVDIDGDGRDEVILGSVVLDPNGKLRWTTGLGHPDSLYVGDIDPARPGLEIYYNIESRRTRDGMCLVEAATGKLLWGYDQPTRHVHSFGLCSDIDPRHPGSECYGADTDAEKKFAFGLLHSATGQLISRENLGGFGLRVAYWDADRQRELIRDKSIVKYLGGQVGQISGKFVAAADILGDWREEIIVSLPGEMRIYTTTLRATDRRLCLLADPIYRNNVAHATMGYYQCPMTSYDLGRQP